VNNNPNRYVDLKGLEKADLREKIADVAACGIPRAYWRYKDSQTALRVAVNSGLKGLWNGPADAFRHCLWSCLMTQSIGFSYAKSIADNHEAAGNRAGQPKNEEQMDLANNKVGRQCGLEKNKQNCSQRCMGKLVNNQLFGLGGVPLTP